MVKAVGVITVIWYHSGKSNNNNNNTIILIVSVKLNACTDNDIKHIQI